MMLEAQPAALKPGSLGESMGKLGSVDEKGPNGLTETAGVTPKLGPKHP